MEGFRVLDPENYGLGGGKLIGERLVANKLSPLSGVVRKGLSDITNNSQHYIKSPTNNNTTKDNIHLVKEILALRQLVQERNKLLELAGTEISKLRTNVLKFQQQNQLLAQTNAQITIERTRDKDRIKVLQHELGCKGALLIIKDVELQEKVKKEPCQMPQTAKTTKRKCEEIKGEVGGDKKPCTRRQSRSQSLAASAVGEQVDAKEEAGNKCEELKGEAVQAEASVKKACNAIRKRQSRTQCIAEQVVAREEAVQNSEAVKGEAVRADGCDRPCKLNRKRQSSILRRQSARFKSAEVEPTEDSFEIEDARFPTSALLDEKVQDGATSSTTEEEKEQKHHWNYDTPVLRTSIGRPMRRAAEKVHSYKEASVNKKMRRQD